MEGRREASVLGEQVATGRSAEASGRAAGIILNCLAHSLPTSQLTD